MVNFNFKILLGFTGYDFIIFIVMKYPVVPVIPSKNNFAEINGLPYHRHYNYCFSLFRPLLPERLK